MNDQQFVRLARKAFKPFLGQLGFRMGPLTIHNNFYQAKFRSRKNAVCVSYEPYDDYLCVDIFSRKWGRLSDIDDHAKTPRLHDLNLRYMPAVSRDEREANNRFFEGIAAGDEAERQLLKAARELRLVLPRYLEYSQDRD